MKEKIKKWLKPVLFTAGGALVGLAYYYFVGCPTGDCPLTSNPFITMDIDPDCYEDMIDKHFRTRYRNCDYNINHFFSGRIRVLRFYETCY